MRRGEAAQPADWIDALHACIDPAIVLLEQGTAPPVEVRRSIGAARKALREPDQLLPSLRQLRDCLDQAGHGRPEHADTA